MQRGQSAIEFLIILEIVVILLTCFFILTYGKIADINKEKEIILLKNIALSVQDEINLAGKATNGYYREFSLPSKINMKDYEVNITAGLIYIKTDINAIAYPVGNVIGNLKKGVNLIRKDNDKVYLN